MAGLAFVAVHGWALWVPVGPPQAHAYASVVWTLAGFHAVHVLVAVLFATFLAARVHRGYASAARPLDARVAAGLWRYTVGQGLVTWAVVHLFPRFA